jgi:hypothetical protein
MATEANWEKGNAAEQKFRNLAQELGWDVVESNLEDDRWKHIDFVITWGDPYNEDHPAASYSVDVKAQNTAENGEETWIEIRNTLGGPGWLYGEADLIAFDQGDRFLVVEREKLKDWIEKNVAREYVDRATLALMKVYTRVGKKDMITLVKTFHLKGLAIGEMKGDGGYIHSSAIGQAQNHRRK